MLGRESRDETLAFNEQIRALLAQLPAVETLPPAATRRARYEAGGLFPPPEFLPHARWEDWNGVRVRVLEPEGPRGTYLHLHGGGWTISRDANDAQARFLAERLL